MLRDRLREEIRRFDPDLPIERASTPPSSWYTDHDLYDLERDAAFAASWQPVARTDELAGHGRYVSGCLAGRPWVVVRDGDELRAFHNVCLHKGREVVTGAGAADVMTCGYHAWSYDLAGRLKRAPRMAGVEDFDRDAMSLRPMRAEAWGPWVWINADLAAPPRAQALAGLEAILERGGWRALRYVDRVEWLIECNWKVYVDNYLDGGYHIPHMHPSLDAQLSMDTYRTELFGEYSIQACEAAGEKRDDLAVNPKARIGEGAVYAWIYPNFMLNRYGPCLDTNYVVPLGPSRCKVVYEFYFLDPDADGARAFIETSMAQSAVTQREDIAICESVQRGLASPAYDRGRYAPRVEHGDHHFHRLLWRTLHAALAR